MVLMVSATGAKRNQRVLGATLVALLAVTLLQGAMATPQPLPAELPLAVAGCGGAEPVPLIELMPEDFAEPAHLPLVDSCPGIRPGARQSNGCTLNFVFRDGAELYIGAAGHCVGSVGQRIGASGVGQFGTVVYRIDQGVGSDFALIRIDADKHSQVEPTMCAWGGPATAEPETLPGQHVHHYGWGVATNDNAETRSRVGALISAGASSINFIGIASGGDSGSPTTSMANDALGVNTHVIVTAQGSPMVYGTSIQRIFTLTQAAGFDLELVPGGPGGLL